MSYSPQRRSYLEQIGYLSETSSPFYYADPISDPLIRDKGESKEGLPTHLHPDAISLSDEDLMIVVDRFRLGFGRKRRETEWTRSSNFELECLDIMRAVDARCDIELAKRRSKK